MHGARANFHVIGLLKNTTLINPEVRELQNQILKIEAFGFLFKFYFNFQVVSNSSRVIKRRSK